VTHAWREGAVARMSMAKLPLAVAKAAPTALAPHLGELAAEVQRRWDAGALRESERAQFCEALAAAASAAGPDTQRQMIDWLLQPVHADWCTAAAQARVATPEAFAAAFMPAAVGPDGAVAVGGRVERWTLFQQITLLERTVKRLQPVASTSAAAAPAAAAPFGAAAAAAPPPPAPPPSCSALPAAAGVPAPFCARHCRPMCFMMSVLGVPGGRALRTLANWLLT